VISLIVHGGAGDIPDRRVDGYRRGCVRALEAGWAVLSKRGTALDAVETAVRLMEDDPVFDAGRGSYMNRDGQIEMDAAIMDGTTLANGAVAAIQRVRHPVSVARLVMERTPHCLIVGEGAERFARDMGVPECSLADLQVDLDDRTAAVSDTVGAVARDAHGNLAAATSTGGLAGKMPGRVGDSPLVGSGVYADTTLGAASATGRGEDLIRIVASKAVCDLMGRSLAPQEAAQRVIAYLGDRVQGQGGLIAMSPGGVVGAAYNTARMARAWMDPDGSIVARV
jgi:L-asparaginase / beta-aspartyl-peptidase